MMQAKVGPNILPGSGRSETPPDHKSTSEVCLKIKLFPKEHRIDGVSYSKIVAYFRTVSLGIDPNKSSNE